MNARPLMSWLLVSVCAACGYFESHPSKSGTTSKRTELVIMQRSVLAALGEGWPSETDCDGTLWAGLKKAAGGDVDLDLAEHEPGVIQRRPAKPCWPNDEDGDGSPDSRSTSSRDMITGYLWGRWVEGDLEAVQRFYDYAKGRDWQFGEPADQPGVWLSTGLPGGRNLVGIICRMLGNCKATAVIYPPVSEDYAQHLQVLGILLFGEVTEQALALVDIDGAMRARLESLAAGSPKDALFQTAAAIYSGDFTTAIDLILDPAYECPGYVRGDEPEALCRVHKAFVLRTLLRHLPEEPAA